MKDHWIRRALAALVSLACLGAAFAVQAQGLRATEMREVPVLARPLAKGETLELDDLTTIEVPAARAQANNIVTDADRLVGQEARRSLRAGEPLRALDLRTPLAVHKGALVTLTYATDTMRLTLVGRAQSDGSLGDTVRVLNIQSSRIVEAVIDGRDSAVVRGPDQIAVK